MKKTTNPFQIAIAFNVPMKCWDLHVQIGNCSTKEEAQKMADLMVEWLKGDSPTAWSQRVS